MSQLLTQNPIALRFLMSETVFSSAFENTRPKHIPSDNDSIKIDSSMPDNKESNLLFWGSNKRNILFLVHNSEENYFSSEAEDAFLKTLTALKLSLVDIAVVNQEKSKNTLIEINKELSPKACIYCEGETKTNQNVFNQIVEIDGITCLYTYSFEEMLTDTNKKRAFWNAIKGITIA